LRKYIEIEAKNMEQIKEKMHEARLQRIGLQNKVETKSLENQKILPSVHKLTWLTSGIALGGILVTIVWLISAGDDSNRQEVASSILEQRNQLVGLPPQSTATEVVREDLVYLTEQVRTLTASVADLKNTLLGINTETDSIASLGNERERNGFQQKGKTSDTMPVLEMLPAPAAGMVDVATPENTDVGKLNDKTNDAVSASKENVSTATNILKRENVRDSGSWAVNIASLPQKEKAVFFVEMAQSKGIDAEFSQVTVKGKEYWRIYVSGFATAAEARTKADQIKEKLDLKDVWVAKR